MRDRRLHFLYPSCAISPVTRMMLRLSASICVLAFLLNSCCYGAPDYTKDIAPIFAKYCNGCHNSGDKESDLSLESFAAALTGGSRGPAIVPGRADASLLMRVLSGETEPAMPPEDSERPTDAEIAILREWIDAGARGPEGVEPPIPTVSTPDVPVDGDAREFATSIAVSPDGSRIALGRYRHIDLIDPHTKRVVATTPELPGKVNSISFFADGTKFVAASGIPGLYGLATIFNTKDASVASQMKGHRDAIYDARVGPGGRVLATCSYDRQIILWDIAAGKQSRTLSGHNGAVFGLAFSSDGAILASASADDTAKIWRVDTGERLDTLGQPEGSQNAVAISPDDKWIVAGGADRKLRMWQLVSREKPRINPLKFSRTAHESPIVAISYSPDGSKLVTASEGGELRLWDTATVLPIRDYEPQPDVVTGIAFAPAETAFYVSRIDGSWERYDAAIDRHSIADGAPDNDATPAAAEITEIPRYDGTEVEPNNAPASANPVTANAVVHGVISKASDTDEPGADLFRFHAAKGQQLIVEIYAARQKSPLDSKVEILDAHGKPIPRVLLQAVRETYFTFRGHNSTDLNDYRLHGWQDMELNEYIYANGEVNKLWLYPRGPDSGFLVYPGFGGPRYAYFGTTAITHALNEPCYIVEAHPPGTKLIPNGLPEFTVYFENDDDGWRKLGADSRVFFTAPDDADYLVRVSDVREMNGDDYKYELTIRAPRPDFAVRVEAPDLTIHAGSGKEFSVVADRMDDFEGEIRVEISGLPPGFHAASPILIQAGQTTAYGVITADKDAPAPSPENSKIAKLTASAMIAGRNVVKNAMDLGELKLGDKPKIVVQVLPANDAPVRADATKEDGDGCLPELIIAPGQTVSAIVRVERDGFNGEIRFGNEFSGRNLPHGVYIDNIGLNGLTLLEGQSERQFFITAAKWVPEITRMFHLRTDVEDNQTSWPVLIRIREDAESGSENANVAAAGATE